MKNQANKQFNENGNVLIIILITIILLAALTFTFMRGDSGSNKTLLTKGEVEIATSQIMKYSKSIENAIKKLQLVNNCSENEISFENSVVAGYTNANSPADKSCHVFDVNGGGLSWASPIANDGSDWLYTATYVDDVTDGVGGDGNELIITLPNISRELCLEINEQVSLPPTSGEPPQDDAVAYDNVKFTGSFPSAKLIRDLPANTISGHATGCFEGDSFPVTGTYHFYHALIVR